MSACLSNRKPMTPIGMDATASSHSRARFCLSCGSLPDAQPETLADDLHPIAEKVDEDRGQRPGMQRDVEGESGVFPAEQPGRQDQVRGAADGRKFRERLDDGEDDDLVERHGSSHRSITSRESGDSGSGSRGRWMRARCGGTRRFVCRFLDTPVGVFRKSGLIAASSTAICRSCAG